MFHWTRMLRKLFSPSPRPVQKPISRRFRPELEVLEDRITPATWTVDTTADTNTGDPSKFAGSLRFCVNNAAAGDTINFAAALDGQTIQLNSQILLTQTSLTIVGQDPNQNPVDVSISGGNGARIFEVQAGNDTIQNLNFMNGVVTGANGGAILVDNGATLNLSNDFFTSNSAGIQNGVGGYGGAIANYGTLTDNGSTFSTNAAYSGGAIYNIGQLTETGSAYFMYNQAATNGGAIESNGGGQGQVNISGSFFYGNIAAFSGGALETWDNTGLSNDTFGGAQAWQANIANGGNGGAIQSFFGTTLNSDQFIGNQANNNGGAIENASGAVLNVSTTDFQNNTARGAGGAIENLGITKIGTFSLFDSNTAGSNGGAIDSENGSPAGQLVVLNSLLTGNTAQGGIGGAINTTDNTLLIGDGFGTTIILQKPPVVLAPNTANSRGGAVSAEPGNDNPAATLTVLACNFLGNKTSRAGGTTGGAIDTSDVTDVETSFFISNNAAFGGAIDYGGSNESTTPSTFTLTVNQDFFQNNAPPTTIAGEGGAIASTVDISAGTSTVSITNSTFYVNGINPGGIRNRGIAENGGGANIRQTTSGSGSASTTLTNDTFFKNTADASGGGIALFLTNTGAGTNIGTLTSLTVNLNYAGADGAGLFVSAAQNGVVSVDNSILSGNKVQDANYNGPVDVTLTNNNALSDKGYNLVGTSDAMFTANTNPAKNNNPGLAQALADNKALPGFIGQTLALNNNSPALGTGDPTLANQPGALGIDERGYTRQAGKVSIGAEDPNSIGLKGALSSTAVSSSLNSAPAGQAITFTAAVTAAGGAPSGTVTFYDGSTELGTATLDSNGDATLTTSSLSLGSHDITATYNGDSNFSGSSGSLTQVISEGNGSPMSLSSSVNPSLPNQAVTFTAHVSVNNGTPTGSVTFFDGVTTLGTVLLDSNANATFTTSALSLGSQTIRAVYSGDATYSSSSASLTQTVTSSETSTSLSSSDNPALPGEAVTFTASVSPAGSVLMPTGTVTFYDGSTALGTATLDSNGNTTFTTSSLATGSHNITATYSGDSNFSTSSSSSLTQVISQKDNSILSLTSSANPSIPNQAVTFTATVSGSSGTPTGSVIFFDTGIVLGTATVDGNGNATLTTSTLSVGLHAISAVYSGDATYNSSGSATLMQTVNSPDTISTLISNGNPALVGTAVTFIASVSPVDNALTPTGTIAFYDGSTVLGYGTLDGNGHATLTTSSLALGSHNITADYSGDGNFNGSSGSLTQVISGENETFMSLTSSVNPSKLNQAVTFTASVSGSNGTPTGTITFSDGDILLGTATLDSNGEATFTSFGLARGSHTIIASYSGDAIYSVDSASLTQIVNSPLTFLTLTSNANPALPGAALTFTATVAPSKFLTPTGTPTGTVTFYDGSTELGSGTLDANGNATLTTTALALGSHDITAVYSGDGSFSGSRGSLTQVISQEDNSSISLWSSVTPSTLNQAVTFTATVSGSSGTPTGSVTFLDGAAVLATVTLDANGNATLTTSALVLGVHTITALYAGDATYGDSSASLTQTVQQSVPFTGLSTNNMQTQPGQAVTFTASVTYSGSSTPTGTVTFLDGTTTLATLTLDGNGNAIFTTSSLSNGRHVITAVYSGNNSYASSSSSFLQTVGSSSLNDPAVFLTSSANSSPASQSVTFTANVSGDSPTPTGTVTFLDGTTVLDVAILDSNGNATFTTSDLALGAHDIIAVYSGDSNTSANASSLTQNIVQAASITSLSSSANPSPSGQAVTFTATVAAADPNAPSPTGTVAFFDGRMLLGTGILTLVNGQWQASFTTSALGLGMHNITAIYCGDASFADSESSLEETISS